MCSQGKMFLLQNVARYVFGNAKMFSLLYSMSLERKKFLLRYDMSFEKNRVFIAV